MSVTYLVIPVSDFRWLRNCLNPDSLDVGTRHVSTARASFLVDMETVSFFWHFRNYLGALWQYKCFGSKWLQQILNERFVPFLIGWDKRNWFVIDFSHTYLVQVLQSGWSGLRPSTSALYYARRIAKWRLP
jgi:hypothetical protein